MSTAWTNGPTVEKLTYLWPSPIPAIGNISHSKHDGPIPPSCSSPLCLVQLGLTSIFCLNKSCLGPRGKEKIKEHAAPACIDWPQKKTLQDELVVRLFRTLQDSIGKIFSWVENHSKSFKFWPSETLTMQSLTNKNNLKLCMPVKHIQYILYYIWATVHAMSSFHLAVSATLC